MKIVVNVPLPLKEFLNMSTYKQVIVMRTDLNMRKGKMIAQGAHASIMFLIRDRMQREYQGVIDWINEGMTKICVRCDSEDQLIELETKAELAGLRVNLITDKGTTEFNGVPTKTCLAIGPDLIEKIDAITGELKLL